MASGTIFGKCSGYEKKLKAIVDTAVKEYKENEEAQKGIAETMRILRSCGGGLGVSMSDMNQGLLDNMVKAEKKAINDIKSVLKDVDSCIEQLISDRNVEDLLYFVDWLGGCGKITDRLVYKNSVHDMNGVGDLIVSSAEKWRYKIDSDAEIQKFIMEERKAALEKDLEENKQKLGALEQRLASEEEKYQSMFDNYAASKESELKKTEDRFYSSDLTKFETSLENELDAMQKAMQAKLVLAKASVFDRSSAQSEVDSALENYKKEQDNYENASAHVADVIKSLSRDYIAYEKGIEAQKKCVDELRNEITNCRIAVSANESQLKNLEV